MANMDQKTGPPPYGFDPAPQPQFNAAPQPQFYPVSEPQPQVILVTSQPQVRLGPTSSNITCPSCRNQISTSVALHSYWLTHSVAAVCLLIGCWLGCCFIPYCVDSCKKPNHYCPSCGAFVGSYDG